MQYLVNFRLAILLFLSIFCYQATVYAAYSAKPIHRVKTSQKLVALTFDDGPGVPYTEQILDILDKHNIKATFFIVGNNLKQHPEIVRKAIEKGHDIGNHSMSHAKLNKKSVQSLVNELSAVDSLIRKQGYKKEIFFRSPFGLLSKNIEASLAKMHKRHFLFDFLPKDWESPPPQVILDRVMKRAKPGFIITLHDGWKNKKNTVIATEMIIKALKQKGYKFVTASELMAAEGT